MFDMRRLHDAHERFIAENEAMLEGELYDAGNVAVAEVAVHPQFTPRTGKLQKATSFRLVRGPGGRIVRIANNAPYAGPIEHGSRPHKIAAKSTKTLRFYTKNGIVFRRAVNHPGNRAYHFLSRAVGVAGETAGHRILAGMQRIARIRL